jgi:Fic family protein
MTNPTIQHIWDPNTGINDIEADSQNLSSSEIPGIKAIWTEQRARLKGTSQLLNFTERLGREWAIETGVIESLYEIERGITQTLIEHGFQAEFMTHGSTNQPREFVLKLLNDQKNALEGIFDFVRSRRTFSVSYIKELHAALLRSQSVTEGVDSQGRSIEIPLIKGAWKSQTNYPVRDGVTYAYCAPEHVASEMDRLVDIHTRQIARNVPCEVQAAWLHHRFTQIHPFQDGNGRVARAITSLVLVKNGLFPLVVTRDDKREYIEALELADGGDLKPLIALITKLQIAQYRKATAISESVLAQDDISGILNNLLKTADKVAAKNIESLRGVLGHAKAIENFLEDDLHTIALSISPALQKVLSTGTASVSRSTKESDHYFRAQIIENAKHHLHYYVDTTEYRSWVALNMNWSRRAKLVFAIHGIGRHFNGSLICAPFLEFRDTDDEGQVRSTIAPITDEGLVFFYNENIERLRARFRPWLDSALKVALKELTQNL